MAKGLEYFIPPELRPAFSSLSKLFKPTPYTSTATKDLLTSAANINKTGVKPLIDSTGRFLSTGLIQAMETNPVTQPIAKISKIGIRGGKLLDNAIKLNTPLNKVLKEIGDEKIATMTNRQLTDYINKIRPDLNIKFNTISQKKLNTIPEMLGKEKLKKAFDSIDNPEQYSVEELLELPVIKKVMKETNMNKNLFKKYKSDFKIKQLKKSNVTNFMDKLEVNQDEVINFIKENPNITNKQIKVQFPKLENVSISTIDNWRAKNNVTRIPFKKLDKTVLERNNPKLQSELDFIPEGSTIPIKHKDAFSEVVTINKKTGPLDVVRTKIVQAHGIGEGGISNASGEIIKSKVAMIPEKFLKEEKLPQFFLTKSGNTAHRAIENNLVLALVNKYDKLGYNFVEGAWKQTKKVNPKSVTKELKALENEIAGYQDELNKLDAYTLFYNPVKDKMVTHGKPLSEIPLLGNLLNKVQSGEKKLRYGGLVGIDRMTRSLREF